MNEDISYHNENFPVGMLVKPKFQTIIKAYYTVARFADDIADSSLLSKEEKIAKLNDIRDAFLNPLTGNSYMNIRKLGKMFVAEQLDASLFTDLLVAFERDAEQKKISIWEELLDYCRYSAAPVGRFLLALHDENPSAYLPAENLCIILQILDHLGDIKDDYSLLRRVYIPDDILSQYNICKTDLGLSYTKPEIKEMLAEIIAKLEAMQADTKVLPSLIKDFRLRFEVCVILSLTNSMIQKYKKVDILQYSPKLGMISWCKAFSQGFVRAIFCKYQNQRPVI